MESLKCMFLLDQEETTYETCKLINRMLKFSQFEEIIYIDSESEEFFFNLFLKFNFKSYFKFFYKKNSSYLLTTNKIFNIAEFLLLRNKVDILVINNYSDFSLNCSLAALRNGIPIIKLESNLERYSEKMDTNFKNNINHKLLNQIINFYIDIKSNENLILKNLIKIKCLKKG